MMFCHSNGWVLVRSRPFRRSRIPSGSAHGRFIKYKELNLPSPYDETLSLSAGRVNLSLSRSRCFPERLDRRISSGEKLVFQVKAHLFHRCNLGRIIWSIHRCWKQICNRFAWPPCRHWKPFLSSRQQVLIAPIDMKRRFPAPLGLMTTKTLFYVNTHIFPRPVHLKINRIEDALHWSPHSPLQIQMTVIFILIGFCHMHYVDLNNLRAGKYKCNNRISQQRATMGRIPYSIRWSVSPPLRIKWAMNRWLSRNKSCNSRY